MNASLVITTKNRKAELRAALCSAVAQTVRAEILVIDDGSNDGTAEMVRTEFPGLALHRFEESRGLIVRRNDGARMASGDVIFSIDDDAAFSTPFVVEQTMRDFVDDRIGAIAIPYIEPHKDNRVMQRAPDREHLWITDRFIGTAHAVRRDLFLKLGGYREHLVHQGEEGDYCIRMLASGHFVRLGNADPINHYESPNRDFRRMDYYGPRNAILFVWQNVPLPFMPFHLAATSIKLVLWSLEPKRLLVRLSGLLAGYSAMAHSERLAVSSATYRLMRTLRRRGPQKFANIAVHLKGSA